MYIYICKKHKDEEKWQTELSSQKLEPKFNWTQTELFFISLLTSFYIEMLMHGRDCNSSFCNRLLLANHSLLMLNEGDDCMHYNLNVKSESLSSLWKWYLPGMKCKERWLASQRGAPVNNTFNTEFTFLFCIILTVQRNLPLSDVDEMMREVSLIFSYQKF